MQACREVHEHDEDTEMKEEKMDKDTDMMEGFSHYYLYSCESEQASTRGVLTDILKHHIRRHAQERPLEDIIPVITFEIDSYEGDARPKQTSKFDPCKEKVCNFFSWCF